MMYLIDRGILTQIGKVAMNGVVIDSAIGLKHVSYQSITWTKVNVLVSRAFVSKPVNIIQHGDHSLEGIHSNVL